MALHLSSRLYLVLGNLLLNMTTSNLSPLLDSLSGSHLKGQNPPSILVVFLSLKILQKYKGCVKQKNAFEHAQNDPGLCASFIHVYSIVSNDSVSRQ